MFANGILGINITTKLAGGRIGEWHGKINYGE